MIEEGIVRVVQANAAVKAMCPLGGFLSELPKDSKLPNWTYRTISEKPELSLQSIDGLTKWRVQVDCYGVERPDVINLSKAIDVVLNGFRGPLPDSDSTYVDSAFRSDKMDFFDDARRSYRRMLEYEVNYLP